MKIKLLVLLLLCSFFNFGQESRTLLKGRLLYRNSNVIAANVINNTAQSNTITDGAGGFEISVRVGDELVFSGYVPSKSKKPIGDRSPSDPAPVAARIRLASVDLSSSSTF